MSGKRGEWQYESDTGKKYIVTLDNSNSKAIVIGYGLQLFYPPFLATELWLPVNITMRYGIAFRRFTPQVKRIFPIGYKPMYDWLVQAKNPGIVTNENRPDEEAGFNTAWYFMSFHGERIDRLNVRRP